MCSLNGAVVTGTIAGNLLLWEGRNCVKTIKAHSVSHSPQSHLAVGRLVLA